MSGEANAHEDIQLKVQTVKCLKCVLNLRPRILFLMFSLLSLYHVYTTSAIPLDNEHVNFMASKRCTKP